MYVFASIRFTKNPFKIQKFKEFSIFKIEMIFALLCKNLVNSAMMRKEKRDGTLQHYIVLIS